ncbi:efflux transporter outer membrane subunit [Chromobacterium alticapitis]|uniref:Fusaric acid resistance protein n=1 Tax=Chromobacterium alticapitis TaxID=2073169 RepID=A0A2S5DAP0_9NEIS|nr:efflux transporter outer membrane subunit [Chromobacterium alticapitis]POZ60155.1 fusaric acid resistance protein [Chromobacterium alticapitis]
MRTMHSFYTAAACLLAATLAGCASPGDSGARAKLLDPNSLEGGAAIAAAADKAGWPRGDWWRELRDAQLDGLMSAALAGNPNLQAAEARLAQARALAGVAEAATRPQAAGELSLTRQRYSEQDFIPPPEAGNYSWYNHASLNAGYDLDLWGRQRATLAAALDQAEMLAAEAQLARLNLAAAIVRDYARLAVQYEVKDLLGDSLAQRERFLLLAKKRKAAGLGTEAEVVLQESRLPALRNQLEQVDENISLLGKQLAALAGKGPGSGDKLTRPLLKLSDGEATLPSALPAELIGRRPDVAARRWQAEAEAKKIDAARAAFYPNINLSAFIGFQAIGFDNFPSSSTAIRGVGPAITLPIFEGGRLRSQLGAQSAAYDAAVAGYNASVVHALNEIAAAVVRSRSLAEQQKQAEQARASAERALKLAQQGYRAGLSEQDGVLSARLSLLDARQQLARIHGERLDSYAALMSALGGGAQTPAPQEARR